MFLVKLRFSLYFYHHLYDLHYKFYYNEVNALKGVIIMSTNKNDYEHMLFYFAYKTFITTADEIIEKYGMSRQHHRFFVFYQ